MKKAISNAVIRRLPRYYRYLTDLYEEGVDRISSNDLSERMNVTASQIRQDLNNFGEFGQQGYGYNVKFLRDEIGKILGLDKPCNMIVIGSGRLGQTLANYQNFKTRGFYMIGMFDHNPELYGLKIYDLEVQPMEELESFIRSHKVDIAVLTMPRTHAEEVANRVIALGVKAIWNFAHLDLNVPDDVVVENVHLSDSLMRLSYMMLNKDD